MDDEAPPTSPAPTGDDQDKVASLEKKVQEQENEITILKSSLADVLRRLQLVEEDNKKAKGPTSPLPRPPSSPGHSARPLSYAGPSSHSPQGAKERPKSTHIQARSAKKQKDSEIFSREGKSLGYHGLNKDPPPLNSSGAIKDDFVRFALRGRGFTLFPPSNFTANDQDGCEPDRQLEIEWVYGYRGKDCRSNLFQLPTGELVYNMAAVVVLYNPETGDQRHYSEHNDDVKCLALHPNKVYIASGQVAGHSNKEGRMRCGNWSFADDFVPHVRIWDSSSLETLQVVGIGFFQRALSCLAFSQESDNGRFLVCVDESNDHVVSVWDWAKKAKVTESKGGCDPILSVAVHPENSGSIITCGKSHISFWTFAGDKLSKKNGLFEKHDKPKFVLCLAFTKNGLVLSGDSNGNIFSWGKGGNRITSACVGAHDGPVFCLNVMEDGSILSGGGRDRKVKAWGENLSSLDMEVEIPDSTGSVRMALGELGDGGLSVVVGTTKNCLLKGTSDNLEFLTQTHADEMWGLDTHPSQNRFLTCSHDKILYMWDLESHKIVWEKVADGALHGAEFNPSGSVVAVGTQSGKWFVVDSESGEELVSFQDGNEAISAIKYAPSGKSVAVGSRDNSIYVYSCSEDGKSDYDKVGRLVGHSSFVTHLDWSKDSQFIQTNSGDYEILFWHAESCSQVKSAPSMRDTEWDTWTCVLGFPVIGIWPEGADGTDLNSCCRSHDSNYIATADDFGHVSLLRFPSYKPRSGRISYMGHSSHVTCVRWLHDDAHVLSAGGKDCSIIQWKVLGDTAPAQEEGAEDAEA